MLQHSSLIILFVIAISVVGFYILGLIVWLTICQLVGWKRSAGVPEIFNRYPRLAHIVAIPLGMIAAGLLLAIL